MTNYDQHHQVKTALQKSRESDEDLETFLKKQAVPVLCFKCLLLTDTPKKCGGCRAVIYCGPECAKAGWKQGNQTGDLRPAQGHKTKCKMFKRHMERAPEIKEICAQFPWGRTICTDGSFPQQAFLASRGLLGAKGFGYWSSPRTLIHSNGHPLDATHPGNTSQLQRAEQFFDGNHEVEGYFSGYMLMERHLQDEMTGWHNLPDEQIPWFNFEGRTAPTRLEAGQVLKNWREWYAWRGLPLDSPVALIMSQPLSIYHMLVDALDIKPLPVGQHRNLIIHLIGAEMELNCIPIFSELALLLPGHNFDITLFGPAVIKVTQKARKHKKSVGSKLGPILKYTAPGDLGGGRISMTLCRDQPLWDKEMLDTAPDVMIGLNAGIGSYPDEWATVIQSSICGGFPLLCTEFTETSLEANANEFVNFFWERIYADVQKTTKGGEGTMGKELWEHMVASDKKPPVERWKVALNPFMVPGQRPVAQARMPSARNGFAYYVQAYPGIKLFNELDDGDNNGLCPDCA